MGKKRKRNVITANNARPEDGAKMPGPSNQPPVKQGLSARARRRRRWKERIRLRQAKRKDRSEQKTGKEKAAIAQSITHRSRISNPPPRAINQSPAAKRFKKSSGYFEFSVWWDTGAPTTTFEVEAVLSFGSNDDRSYGLTGKPNGSVMVETFTSSAASYIRYYMRMTGFGAGPIKLRRQRAFFDCPRDSWSLHPEQVIRCLVLQNRSMGLREVSLVYVSIEFVTKGQASGNALARRINVDISADVIDLLKTNSWRLKADDGFVTVELAEKIK